MSQSYSQTLPGPAPRCWSDPSHAQGHQQDPSPLCYSETQPWRTWEATLGAQSLTPRRNWAPG